LNGGEKFCHLLEQLACQSVQIDELLVIDSSSDDKSVLKAKEFGARAIVIPRRKFDHGATRAIAAREARGDFLLYFTQDAVPKDRDFVKKLLAPLLQDDTIALSYGRQLPNNNATVFARALRLFNYPEQSEIREFSDKKKVGLKTVFVSNSCAVYRKTSLQEIGWFAEGLIFGEDTCAAGQLLKKGYKIAYVAEAAVFHSHNYSIAEEFNRYFDIGVLHRLESWLPETFGRAEGEGFKYIKFEFAAICREKKYYLLPVFFCRNLAKLIGYKLGGRYYALPQWLLIKFSMNKIWWRGSVD
jgi:rhamnosyltransferase